MKIANHLLTDTVIMGGGMAVISWSATNYEVAVINQTDGLPDDRTPCETLAEAMHVWEKEGGHLNGADVQHGAKFYHLTLEGV